MLDVVKFVAYWRDGAKEDWAACQDLVRTNRRRQAMFFAHLTIEKLLKAHICLRTKSMPPRIHSLPRLAELAMLAPNPRQLEILAEINRFNLEGRYPEDIEAIHLTQSDVRYYLKRAKEIYLWLKKEL